MSSDSGPPVLLLADDDETNRYVLRRILEGAGYRIAEASTAAETRRMLYDCPSPPSLVILDVHLPDGNGYELCRVFKADPRTAKIPILQMSAMFTAHTDHVQGLECGADSYLVQPADPGVLIATVRALLRIAKIEATLELLLERERLARREAELERQKLHSFFMQAPAAVWILRGPEHVFELVNPQASALTGEGQALGMRLRDALPESIADGSLELLDRVYRTGEPSATTEQPFRVKQPDGAWRTRFFNFVHQPCKDVHGVIDGILSLAVDVTEQVLARKQVETLAANLKAALNARNSFLSIASHELKTPLTSLKLQSQLGMRELDKNDPAVFGAGGFRKMIEGTNRQVDRLNRLVEDMLDVTRIETGKLSLTLERIDLSALAREILESHSSQLEAAGSRFSLHASQPVVGHWDRHRIEQIVVNLLSNASKYGSGKPVTITIGKRADMAVLKVSDQGIGIAADQHEFIFEQFKRAASAQSISGLGLGLFIVRNIVTQHQGRIRVESELGKGATFTVELPLAASESRCAS